MTRYIDLRKPSMAKIHADKIGVVLLEEQAYKHPGDWFLSVCLCFNPVKHEYVTWVFNAQSNGFAQKGKDIQPMAYASLNAYEEVKNGSAQPLVHCPEQRTDGVTCRSCQLCWKLPDLKRPINIYFEEH